jgi:hypothetical protein
MLIDGNKMIEILGLPEWDERVLDILEEFEEERPELENDDDIYPLFKNIKEYGINLMFNDVGDNIKQRNDSEGNIYLNTINLKSTTTIKLPFGIEMGDDKDTIEKKIGEKVYAKNDFLDNRLHWLLDDGEKKYFLTCNFNNQKLENLDLALFDEEVEYEMTLL